MADDAQPRLRDGDHVHEGAPIPLDRALRELSGGVAWGAVRKAISSGKISVDGTTVSVPKTIVSSGAAITVRMAAPRHGAGVRIGREAIVHLDSQIVVVRKPPRIASVPDDTYRRGTLAQVIGARLRGRSRREVPLGVVQRLDLETSGLLVFARSAEAREHLKAQLKEHTVQRSYLAIVSGDASNATYRSRLVEHSNGKRSSTRHRHLGKFACTHVQLLQRLRGTGSAPDSPRASLIRCELETGRTHQIRIQLSEAGHPLLGDRRYARRAIPTPAAPRVMLHAATLGFVHPQHERPMMFEEPLPDDMQEVLTGLGWTKESKQLY